MSKGNILIVENESIVALNIESRLQEMGYTVSSVVFSGEEAIAVIEANPPDLVLMDIRLKGNLDGIQVAEQIRDRCKIPVVYLTAHSDQETLERAKITEPYGYILKPFEARELGSIIEIALYKHRIEQQLKTREQWLATTLKSIGDAVITTDANGCITYMNPAAEELTGWKRSESKGLDLSQVFRIINERTRETAVNPAIIALREGAIVNLENQTLLIAKDGTEIPIDDSAAPIKDEAGNITGAVLVFHDIIDRKQAESALRESETRFRAIFDQTFNFVVLLEPSGTILEANQTILDFGGVQRTEVVGQLFWETCWWTLSTAAQNQLREAIASAANGEFVRYEVEIIGAANRVITIDFSIKPVIIQTEQVVLLIAEGRDISDKKQVEAALQKLNEELEIKVQDRTAKSQENVEPLQTEISEHQQAKMVLGESKEKFYMHRQKFNRWVWHSGQTFCIRNFWLAFLSTVSLIQP